MRSGLSTMPLAQSRSPPYHSPPSPRVDVVPPDPRTGAVAVAVRDVDDAALVIHDDDVGDRASAPPARPGERLEGVAAGRQPQDRGLGRSHA